MTQKSYIIYSQWRLYFAEDTFFNGSECSTILAGEVCTLQIDIKKTLTNKDPYVRSICNGKDDWWNDGEVKDVTSAT